MKTIIRKSIITEKATSLTEKRNSYTFEVEFKSNKLEIKGAIQKLYNVRVTAVRTMNYGGGVSSVKFTNKGIVEQKSKQWKKAVVTVADGQFIELFNNY